MVTLFISHVHFLRDALVQLLRADGLGAWEAGSAEAVEAAARDALPDLVVVDAAHPDAAGLVAVVRGHAPRVRVVVLALRERDEDFLAWADLGIAGFLGPDTSARELVAAVRRAGAGEVVCPPRLAALLLNRFADRSGERAARAGIHALTPREREIVELLADGLPNKLIARRLQVALPTVKNHVHSILDKWDVRSRGEAAARYRRKMEEAEPERGRLVSMRPGPGPAGPTAASRPPALPSANTRQSQPPGRRAG